MMKTFKFLTTLVFMMGPFAGASDPCALLEDDDEPDTCIRDGNVCSLDPEGCCDGLKCTGFGFFKKCTLPAVCLEEWYDCEDGTECCDGRVCTETNLGAWECRTPEIAKRTIKLPGITGELAEEKKDPIKAINETAPPTQAPVGPNLKTTTVPGAPIKYNVGSMWGDPHAVTFDGLSYDCQGEGEFVMLQSIITQRQVQGRFRYFHQNNPTTIMSGVAIQDEGDTPRVQVQFPDDKTTVANDLMINKINCPVMVLINGEPKVLKDLLEKPAGFEDQLRFTRSGSKISILYLKSQLQVDVSAGHWHYGCYLSAWARVPDVDPLIGLMGTPDGNITNDWTTPEGIEVEIPKAMVARLRKPGTDFCKKHYCLRDESKSIFAYTEDGWDFEDYERCDLPYAHTIEKYLATVDEEIREACGTDLRCIIDAVNGGLETVVETRNAALEIREGTCNNEGGECSMNRCCPGLDCIDMGLAGKECRDTPACMPEGGDCNMIGCCGDLVCETQDDGRHQCVDSAVCRTEWNGCDDKPCCDGLTCVEHASGSKQCRDLPVCAKQWDDCSLVGCCGDLKCADVDGRKQCLDLPECWDTPWRDCSLAPCCEGLRCIEGNGRKVCADLPQCMGHGLSCEWVPCCENEGGAEVACVEVTDNLGRSAKQCRYQPYDVKIRVWDDKNLNGIMDESEEGIPGVSLRLVTKRTATDFLPDQNNGGNAHEVLTTDAEGFVTFERIPRGLILRAYVVKAPTGSRPTHGNRGTDHSKNSKLEHQGFSNWFRIQPNDDVHEYRKLNLGYLMPTDSEVRVFADLNANGLQDAGEPGIEGVQLRLVKNEKDMPDLEDQENGGNAHEVLTTDPTGHVTFTKLPLNTYLRVKVIKGPTGAIATKADQGGKGWNDQDDTDSDLFSNGLTHVFIPAPGAARSSIDLGYIMPESVSVRVWDDTDSNGVQDEGEPGIPGVKLRLVKYSREKGPKPHLEDQKNGGNAHEVVESDANGMVTFTKVPQGVWLHVQVEQGPLGAIATHMNKGGDEAKDSDLYGQYNITYQFRLNANDGQAPYADVDIGYRMPNSAIIRVWDDINSNGLQDEGEPGISGVKLRLIKHHGGGYFEDQKNGGNIHEELTTNEKGLVTFTKAPQNVYMRVKVTNAPTGAINTFITWKKGMLDTDKDSDLESSGVTKAFIIHDSQEETSEIDIGYKMPMDVKVRVWDDINYNGIQEEGEPGIEGVELVLFNSQTKDLLKDQGNGGNAHTKLTTGEDGTVTFTECPRGAWLQVKVVNHPSGALRTHQNRGGDNIGDSDLQHDGMSERFHLGAFGDGVFDQIDLGYRMPADMKVRVWDDLNDNGMQDEGEPGISGVKLRLWDMQGKKNLEDLGTGGNAHEELETDEDGRVVFTEVPKTLWLQVKVMNQPPGAVQTHWQKGGKDKADEDSDLNHLGYSLHFHLSSFAGPTFEGIDLGYRMPDDVVIRVWNDANANGIQDEEEEGIEGVKMRLVNHHTGEDLPHQAAGSTAHEAVTSNRTGHVLFKKVPKNIWIRAEVLNAPPGSQVTHYGKGKQSEGSDFDAYRQISRPFHLASFMTDSFEDVDLGYIMPKTMVSRVWSDLNGNGVQDEGEPGIPGVVLKLVEHPKLGDLPDQENDGTAHLEVTTDEAGRATWTKVPLGKWLRIQVVKAPENYKPTRGNRGDDKLDSDLENNGRSNAFRLAANADELFDIVDLGYVPTGRRLQ